MSKEWEKYSLVAFSPHIVFLPEKRYLHKLVQKHREKRNSPLYFLDVGGRTGGNRTIAVGYDEYHILEIDKTQTSKGVIYGDICHCPQIADRFYDVVYSHNVFEHLKEPWKAAEECVRIAKTGALLIHLAPFSWRYHPVPVDFFRYTHDGLKYLFERTCQVKTIFAGYNISKRRKDCRGGKLGLLDVPPIDKLGGWREQWLTIFVGVKLAK